MRKVYVIEEDDFHQRKLNLICTYSALYIHCEFVLLAWLHVFSNIAGIVRKSRIKKSRLSHGNSVPMFVYFKAFKFDFKPLLFLPWESQNLIWSRLSFQTFSKMQGTTPKRKKKNVGWLLLCLQCSLLGCLSYHSSRITKNLMCCISSRLTRGRNSFCGSIFMLEH